MLVFYVTWAVGDAYVLAGYPMVLGGRVCKNSAKGGGSASAWSLRIPPPVGVPCTRYKRSYGMYRGLLIMIINKGRARSAGRTYEE